MLEKNQDFAENLRFYLYTSESISKYIVFNIIWFTPKLGDLRAFCYNHGQNILGILEFGKKIGKKLKFPNVLSMIVWIFGKITYILLIYFCILKSV